MEFTELREVFETGLGTNTDGDPETAIEELHALTEALRSMVLGLEACEAGRPRSRFLRAHLRRCAAGFDGVLEAMGEAHAEAGRSRS